MTPLERAARAIAAIDYRKGVRDCEHPNDAPAYTPIPWDSLPAKAQAESIEKARAALTAIREPSPAMLTSTWIEKGVTGIRDDYTAHTVAREAWQAMIDAALAEGV